MPFFTPEQMLSEQVFFNFDAWQTIHRFVQVIVGSHGSAVVILLRCRLSVPSYLC